MRRLTVLVLALAVVLGIAAPVAADHGGPVEGLWLAKDNVDGSLMLMTVAEADDGSGDFTVVYTDTRATGGCEPATRFRAVSDTGSYDPNNGRFFASFDQIRCLGRSVPTLDFFELQFCTRQLFEGDEGYPACSEPGSYPVAPNTMVDFILDVNEEPIGGGNVWHHIHG